MPLPVLHTPKLPPPYDELVDFPEADPESMLGIFHDNLYSKENIEKALTQTLFKGSKELHDEKVKGLSESELGEFMQMYVRAKVPRADRKYHVIIYGVSGYTGRLILEYIKRHVKDEGFTFACAGRTPAKVEAVLAEVFAGHPLLGKIDVIRASLDNVFDIERMVHECRVVVNVAGPFMLTGGEALVEACIEYDTDYVDVNGEIPYAARLLEWHEPALKAAVHVVPCAAYAGGMPDLGAFWTVKRLRETFGEETRRCRGYLSTEGNVAALAPSGGTLATRAAMATSTKKDRAAMANNFSLGGRVHGGHRDEDQDAFLNQILYDDTRQCWLAPHQYAFFETRVVRRANMLSMQLRDVWCARRPAARRRDHRAPSSPGFSESEHRGGESRAFRYGRDFNFTCFLDVPDEKVARDIKKTAASSRAEVKELEQQGKLYKAGEGPPIEELLDERDVPKVSTTYAFIAEGAVTGRKFETSFTGGDGYYETAHMAVEVALSLALHRPRVAARVRGGVLTPAISCGEVLFERLTASGFKYAEGVFEAKEVAAE